MERVVLRNDGLNTKLEIDGVEIQNLYSVKIEKTPDGPIKTVPCCYLLSAMSLRPTR